MNKADIKVGNEHVIKVSGNITRVRILSKSPDGGWLGKLQSGREIRVRNAARLLAPIEKMKKEYGPSYFAKKMSGLADAAGRVTREERAMAQPPLTEVLQ